MIGVFLSSSHSVDLSLAPACAANPSSRMVPRGTEKHRIQGAKAWYMGVSRRSESSRQRGRGAVTSSGPDEFPDACLSLPAPITGTERRCRPRGARDERDTQAGRDEGENRGGQREDRSGGRTRKIQNAAAARVVEHVNVLLNERRDIRPPPELDHQRGIPPTVADSTTDGSLEDVGAAAAVASNGEKMAWADTVHDLEHACNGGPRRLVSDDSVSASEPVLLEGPEDFAHENRTVIDSNCLTVSVTQTPLRPYLDFSSAADAPVDASNSSHGEPRGGLSPPLAWPPWPAHVLPREARRTWAHEQHRLLVCRL
ncbi:hypothetical protein B0H14DRAFT_2574046 [Mycena olivaceomarginata]|nr:hypothetical protein B0H14DRAFT_2574046 [Mycena olivaceomarginata]